MEYHIFILGNSLYIRYKSMRVCIIQYHLRLFYCGFLFCNAILCMYNSIVEFYNKYKRRRIESIEAKTRERIKEKYVQIYRGKLFRKRGKPGRSKVVVFDLDETLGSFSDIESLWSGIHAFSKNRSDNQPVFSELMNLYPEFLRTGILSILSFLYDKKTVDESVKLFIYTNNQCPSPWTHMISQYLHMKVARPASSVELFDQIVCAFKIGDRVVETLRTSHHKTYSDFIRCTMLPKTFEICFLDNVHFSKMENDRVYYIQPRSYYHGLDYQTIMDRFVSYGLSKGQYQYKTEEFLEFMYNWFRQKGSTSFHRFKPLPISKSKDNVIMHIENAQRCKSPQDYMDDKLVSQKIMYHIKEFFLMNTNVASTKKIRSRIGHFTKKRYSNIAQNHLTI